MIEAKLTLSPQTSRFFRQGGVLARAAMGEALYQEAEGIITLSKERYVPVDTGQLRASGHVLPPAIIGDGVEVTLGFGNSAVAYAAVVHERVYRKDGTTLVHHPIGQAKYLERAAMESIPGMAERVEGTFWTYLTWQLGL